jgi:hypothetical protein
MRNMREDAVYYIRGVCAYKGVQKRPSPSSFDAHHPTAQLDAQLPTSLLHMLLFDSKHYQKYFGSVFLGIREHLLGSASCQISSHQFFLIYVPIIPT